MKGEKIDLGIGTTCQVTLERYGFTRILDSSVEINTTADEAWRALADFESWADWNTFIPVARGELRVGGKMGITVKSPGLKAMDFKPVVYEVETGRRIVWGGGSLLIGYRGTHAFIIEPIDKNRIRFRQIEKFEGPIVLFMSAMIAKTAVGYSNMNEEFKALLEKK